MGIELIKRAMTRDQYLKVKQMLHLCNNEKAAANKSDRAFKIRSFITMLQKSFGKFGIFETHVAVDDRDDGEILWTKLIEAVHQRETCKVWL